jgi:hypothetical protein
MPTCYLGLYIVQMSTEHELLSVVHEKFNSQVMSKSVTWWEDRELGCPLFASFS